MTFTSKIAAAVNQTLQDLYAQNLAEAKETSFQFQINDTKPEFEGDYTIVLFALVKSLRKSPEIIGQELGEHLLKHNPSFFSSFPSIS